MQESLFAKELETNTRGASIFTAVEQFFKEHDIPIKSVIACATNGALSLTLSLPRSSIDDFVFSVFTSNFVELSYKISLIKNRFVTLFFIRFS